MKRRIKQGKKPKYIFLMIMIVIISLSVLSLAACNREMDVVSIRAIEDRIPQYSRVSEFDITQVTLEVLDSNNNKSTVFVTPAMLTTDSRNMLKTSGTHNITVMYYKKSTTFSVTLFEDDAELVTVKFNDRNNNLIKEMVTQKGKSVQPPAHPVIEGMLADGWVDKDNNEVSFGSIEQSIEVKAKYAKDVQVHTVTFKDYQENIVATMQVEQGNKLPGTPSYDVPEEIASWDWYYGNSKLDISKLTVTQDLEISMRVDYYQHTVIYQFKNVNGETVQLGQEPVRHNQAATGDTDAIELLYDYGYNFIRWKTPFNVVKMDLIVEAEASIFTYEVKFYDYTGAVMATDIVNHGDNATPPLQATERPGYIFNGEWEGGSLLNVQKNLNLTAVYIPKNIEITLYDGATPEIKNMDFGTIIDVDNLQELKTKEGNILLGLYEDSLLTRPAKLPYTVTINDTLYIKWIDTIKGNSELVYVINEEDAHIVGYNGNDSIIYIPSRTSNLPVTVIESDVFKGKNILKVNFGDNIKEIKSGAFENTKLGGSLELPDGLTTIGARAFADCVDIESVVLPDSVTNLHQSAFEGATKLRTVSMGQESNLQSIDNSVFKGCASLISISLPISITSIGESAFEGSGLISINLNKVNTVGANAFKDCINLTNINLGDTDTINAYAFFNTAITEIDLTKVTVMDSYAFASNRYLSTVTVGFIDTIKSYAFADCQSLITLTFLTKTNEENNNGVKTIEDYAFNNCNNLISIDLPFTLQSISAKAFSGALKLNDIIVSEENESYKSIDGVLYNADSTVLIAYPSGRIIGEFIVLEGVTAINDSAFADAIIAKLVLPASLNVLEEKSLYSKFISTIEFLGDLPDIVNDEAHELDIVSDELWKLYVPEEFIDNYVATSELSIAEITPVPYVDGSIYDEVSGLVYIIENNEVYIIAANRTLTTLTVPQRINNKPVNKILAYAFENCDKLQTINIQANILELGEYAFKGCVNLNSITFSSIQRSESGSQGTIINLNAFEDTPWYKQRDLIVIADTAFEYKYALDNEGDIIEVTSLTIPSEVEVLNADLFNNEAGKQLQSINLSNVEIIRERAFYNTKIKSIYLSSQVNEIGESAFENCIELEVLNIRYSGLTKISSKAFKGCVSIEEVILPLNINTIEDQAFMNCTLLREISLPNALTRIGDSAFYGCVSMPVIHIPNKIGVGIGAGELAIGNQAFASCNSLVYIRMWSATAPTIGVNVFDSSAYIYVEDSDGEIENNYKNTWTVYAEQIKEQADSPILRFEVDKDIDGTTLEAMRNISLEELRISVLYEETELPEVQGYMFVCWNYYSEGLWKPVSYPFLVPVNTTLRARWVLLDEGSFTDEDVSYNSSMDGYIIDDYTGTDTKVVIPSEYKGKELLTINNEVFYNRTDITDIIFILESNLRFINYRAFAGMTSLTSITLPSSLTSIGNEAFSGCINLEYIFIPKTVESIGENAFEGCNNLNIVFEEGSQLRYAYINSFSDTLWYEEQKADEQSNFVIAGRLIIEYMKNEDQNLVTLPIKAVALRDELFMDDADLVTVEFHPEMEFIGARCFYNCSSLINLDFRSSEGSGVSNINYVGIDAFTNTPWSNTQDVFEQAGGVLIKYKGSDTEVNLPDTITMIEKNAFAYKAITSITLSKNLKIIADKAFYNCVNLTNIVIPSQVTYIGEEAFSNNIRLKSVVFAGNNLKEIGNRAFYNCSSLGTDINQPILTLPSSLTTLGSSAFEGCNSLTNINLADTKLSVINSRTFYGNSSLNRVTLSTVTERIGANAFTGCTNLETLTVGANSALRHIDLTSLSDTAWFKRTDDQEDVLIYIGNILLKYRQKIGSAESSNVTLPTNIKYIAAQAFENANILSVNLPDQLIEIGRNAFAGCEYLVEITIPDSVESIGEYAFAYCTRLATVTLGTGVEEIQAYSFFGCYDLTKVTLNRISYGELTDTQLNEINAAKESQTIGEWLDNNNIYSGTRLLNVNAFNQTSHALRIYVANDSLDFNKEFYLYKWSGLSSRIFYSGNLPTVSFVNIDQAEKLEPISTEYLTEADLQTTYKNHTLLGWEIVNSPDDPEGEKISLPFKVIENITLRPIWLANNRTVTSTIERDELGFTYAPNAAQNAYTISSYAGTHEMIVIPSKVNGYSLIGINNGVFTEANTSHVKTIMITDKDNLAVFNANPFSMFENLEKIIINGNGTNYATVEDYYNRTEIINSNYVTIDGVLYTKDLKTLVSYPRARKLNDKQITSYTISYGVEEILAYAFNGCKLVSLEIPDSVMVIGEGAFDNNDSSETTGLRTITFGPESQFREIAYGAFDQTIWYQQLSGNFKIAGTYLLNYFGYSEEVTVPNTIKTIGIRAFENNNLNNISKLTIPSSVERINEDAFVNCSDIVSIIFATNSSLMYAANDVFMDTSWITAMNLEANEFVIAGNILVEYNGGRDYLALPNEVKVIGYNAFNNASFSSISLHNNLVRIDENAFFGSSNLTSISIPSSVTEIGDHAFYSCLELSEVTFEEGSVLKDIGIGAFSYCTKLASFIVPDSVMKIGDSAFEYCTNMASLTITENSQLQDLGASAFKNARRLVEVYFPNGLSEIKTSTFEGCEALLKFAFSNENRRLTKIGENAFKNCLSLGSDLEGRKDILTVELPYNVNRVESGAFYGCSSLYGIRMQGQITYIGLNAFYGCSKMSNVTISTSEPPEILASSFNFSAHPKLRIYVNISPDQTVLNSYKISWGDQKVAESANIFERRKENLPLVQYYDYTAGGEEILLSNYSVHSEVLSASLLPVIRHDTKGMAIGFYTSNNFEVDSQICTATNPYKIVQDNILKVYVKWENI